MKDSQLTPHALSKPGKYIKVNNERLSTDDGGDAVVE